MTFHSEFSQTRIPELEDDSVTVFWRDKDAAVTLVSESDQSSSEQALIDLDDLEKQKAADDRRGITCLFCSRKHRGFQGSF
ncbi:MAG: hypothetical protein CM1200mP30_33710 [Pseudomonadota bacterium]|nr:MAG: hypothetical protein CM1200mP30_33710 [Pseudomonadota bacterium]